MSETPPPAETGQPANLAQPGDLPQGDLPQPGDIALAAERLAGRAVTTPLLDFPLISAELGFRLLVKAETLQLTGSFKFRGACNKLLAARQANPHLARVVAYSSGNHAQGVAAAARLLGLKASIVMPRNAPAIKIRNTRALGAEIVLYDRGSENREAIAAAIAEKHGALIVPPYDDPLIIAGQGTVGREICFQSAALGFDPDIVIAPCGGGGLISGTAIAVKDRLPKAEIFAAEPADYDDLRRSLETGSRQRNDPATPPSICDALMAEMPGRLTFEINRRLLSGALAVSDAQVLGAMKFAMTRLKLMVEPGGAAALAAALSSPQGAPLRLQGKNVVVICSGGNADPEMIGRALAASD